jgi:hypothetical protein
LRLLDAYQLHRTELTDFSRTQGSPLEVHTMATYLAFGPLFRERHIDIILRRGLQIQLSQPYFWTGSTILFLIGTLLSGVAPGMAILIFVLGFSTVGFYLTLVVQARPRVALACQVVIVLLLVLLPLDFTHHKLVLLHVGMIGVLLLLFNHYLPANTKAFVEEIKSAETKVDRQVE